jgi:hypothetical protein
VLGIGICVEGRYGRVLSNWTLGNGPNDITVQKLIVVTHHQPAAFPHFLAHAWFMHYEIVTIYVVRECINL